MHARSPESIRSRMDDFAMLPPFRPRPQGVLLRQVAPFVPRGDRGMQIKAKVSGFRFQGDCRFVVSSFGRLVVWSSPGLPARTSDLRPRISGFGLRARRNQYIRVSDRRLRAMAGNNLRLRVTCRAQMSSVSASGIGLCRLRDPY